MLVFAVFIVLGDEKSDKHCTDENCKGDKVEEKRIDSWWKRLWFLSFSQNLQERAGLSVVRVQRPVDQGLPFRFVAKTRYVCPLTKG